MEKTERITVTIPKSIMNKIRQKKEKDVSLSRHVLRLLEKGLGVPDKEKKQND